MLLFHEYKSLYNKKMQRSVIEIARVCTTPIDVKWC